MIIQLKKQLTCLEVSQKMKALGFPQDSLWFWMRQDSEEKEWGMARIVPSKDRCDLLYDFKHKDIWMGIQPTHFISAYTVAELLDFIYFMSGLFPCIHDRNLNPEQLTDYLAQVACDIKETENE